MREKHEMAYSMMRFPGKEPDIKDFFPNGINFREDDWGPDEVEELYLYKQEWFWYNVGQSAIRDESIPSVTYLTRIMNEIGFNGEELSQTGGDRYDEELFDRLLFAGSIVHEDREWQSLSDEEKQWRTEVRQGINKEFNDPDSEFSQVINEAIAAAEKRDEDVNSLGHIFDKVEEAPED